MQTSGLGQNVVIAVALTSVIAVAFAACGTEDRNPRGSGSGTASGVGGHATTSGNGGAAHGACEGSEIQACKVQIDENNCFVGEQQCVDGMWGDCVDAGEFDSAAFGGASGCPTNPCNPWCQEFGDETPSSPIEAGGTPPPAGGPINGLPSNWQNVQGDPCADDTECFYDTHCVSGTCTAWAYDGFDPAATTLPDLTAPVQCDDSYIQVCNRANVTIPPGTDIVVAAFNAETSDFGTCTPTTTLKGSCTYSGGIGPGECVAVTGCTYSGTSNIYVNYDNPMGTAVAETTCENNWSVHHPSSACACTNVSSTGSLSKVNMLLVLDNSGSMDDGSPNDSWSAAQSALPAFLTSASADTINLAFTVYDYPNGDCDAEYRGGTCDGSGMGDYAQAVAACQQLLYGPALLSNATHEMNITNWLSTHAAGDGPGGGTQTPHSASLEGAANVVRDWNMTTYPGEKNVIVYISDGGNDNCGANEDDVAAKVTGIETYTIALPGSSLSLLNKIAVQGGTGAAHNLRMPTDLPTEFRDALIAIQQATANCTLDIQNAGQVDFDNLTLTFTPSSGMPITLDNPPVADLMACDANPPAGTGQYYLTPVGSPTEVNLCPHMCNLVQSDLMSSIQVVGECIGGYAPTTIPAIPYTADCGAIGTGQPVWEFLRYDTTQIGDSSIEFQVSFGVDEADALAGPFYTVSTATVGSPDQLGTTPVDLYAALLALNMGVEPLVQQPAMALQFVINPTTGGAASPQLLDWSLQYSCLDLE